MSDIPAYERDSYATSLSTDILAVGAEAGRPYVRLADTVLFPGGGGQPPDRGWIGEATVVDIECREDGNRHFLDRPLETGPVEVRLDWARRFDHMQHHTGQHLLSAIAEDEFGWRTTSFHLQEAGLCDVELATEALGAGQLAALEEAVAGQIRAAHPVRSQLVDPARLGSDPRLRRLRTRGLPEGHSGSVRLVEIDGIDLNTCGGTHLGSTAEIELVHFAGTDAVRGGTRLYFVCGGRARRRLSGMEARDGELRVLLGVPSEELVTALRARVEQARVGARREKWLAGQLAAVTAAQLAAGSARVAHCDFEAMDLSFLQDTGRRFLSLVPAGIALLTASADGAALFVVAAGPQSGVDLKTVGPVVAGMLGARGGGDARLFQGKAASLEGRMAVLELLRSHAIG